MEWGGWPERGDGKVLPGWPEDARHLAGEDRDVHLDHEVEAVVGPREGGCVTHPEAHPGGGIEAKSSRSPSDHLWREVESPHSGSRILPGEEERRLTGPAAEIEHPLGPDLDEPQSCCEGLEVLEPAGSGSRIPRCRSRVEEGLDRTSDERPDARVGRHGPADCLPDQANAPGGSLEPRCHRLIITAARAPGEWIWASNTVRGMAGSAPGAKLFTAVGGVAVLVVLGLVLLLDDRTDQTVEPVVKEGSVERPVPGEALGSGESASVVFETNLGTFEVLLDSVESPIAANNFAYLAKNGFYDGLGFHRIVPGFVIQGGDPRGDGSGGPGYVVSDPPEPDTIYRPGTVAMAKSGSDPSGAAGSQFFVVTAEQPIELEPVYAVVGSVSSGFSVVEQIGRLGGSDEKPTETVVIERARLVEG